MADVSRFIDRAELAFKRRNFDYAIQMYLEALNVDPANAGARMALRMILLKSSEDGIKIKAPSGRTLVMTRDPKVALAEYEKSVVREVRSPKYNMRVAQALVELGHHEAAGKVYLFVIDYCDKGKENVAAMKAGAQAFIDAGKPELAQQLLSKALKLAPSDKELADLQRNLAASATLSKISAATGSRDMLKDAALTNELELLNKKVLSIPEIKQALAIVEKKLEAAPLDKLMIKKKAELYGKARKYDAAHVWLAARAKDIEGASDLVELSIKYKNLYYQSLLAQCERKQQEEPDKADAWKHKATTIRKERSAFHLEQYRRQVEEAPADMDSRFRLGRALFETGQMEEAVEHLQKAARSPKVGKGASILLARCFSAMGRYDVAVMTMTSVREQLGSADEELSVEARYWLADIYQRQGDSARAKALFQELFMENAAFRDVKKRMDALSSQTAPENKA